MAKKLLYSTSTSMLRVFNLSTPNFVFKACIVIATNLSSIVLASLLAAAGSLTTRIFILSWGISMVSPTLTLLLSNQSWLTSKAHLAGAFVFIPASSWGGKLFYLCYTLIYIDKSNGKWKRGFFHPKREVLFFWVTKQHAFIIGEAGDIH